MAHIWVVEIKKKGKYVPTTGSGLSRDDAYLVKNEWEVYCPDDKFRVKKYIREGG